MKALLCTRCGCSQIIDLPYDAPAESIEVPLRRNPASYVPAGDLPPDSADPIGSRRFRLRTVDAFWPIGRVAIYEEELS